MIAKSITAAVLAVIALALPARAGPDSDLDRVLVAFDGRTGDELWRVRPGAERAALDVWTADDGVVVADETWCESAHRLPYTSGSHAVVAFDAETGAERWRAPDAVTQRRANEVDLRYADGPVPVDFVDGAQALGALDADTGAELWRGDRGEIVAMNHRSLFVTGMHLSTRRFHAYDRATGAEQWSFDVEKGFALNHVGADDDFVAVMIWPSRGSLSKGTSRVVVLDAATGAVRHELAIPPRFAREEAVFMGSSLLISGWHPRGGRGLLTAYDAATGARLWDRRLEIDRDSSVDRHDRVYGWTDSGGGIVSAVDASDGRTLWRADVDADDAIVPTGTSVAWVDSDDVVHGIDAVSGRELWQRGVPDRSQADPIGGNGAVYFSGGCSTVPPSDLAE